MRPKIRQIAPLIAVSALVLCLYPLRAKTEAETRQAAQHLVRRAEVDAVAPEEMPLPEELGVAEGAPTESDEVLEELTTEQQAQMAAGAEYLEEIRNVPGAAPLLDEILAYLKDGGEDIAGAELPVDDDGMIALDDPMAAKLIKNPEIKAKWDQLMALLAANPPAKHQLRN